MVQTLAPYFPVIVFIIGCLLWFCTTQTKPNEAGRLMFWTGLLAMMLLKTLG